MRGRIDTPKYTYAPAAPAARLAALLLVAAAAAPAAGQVEPGAECLAGSAGPYACDGIDLRSRVSVAGLGGSDGVRLNDLWGWEDPDSGRHYALVGRTDGTAFVDVTDPDAPVYLGSLPSSGEWVASDWRDVKVYGHHAYVVADAVGEHGLQVFDLFDLRGVESPRTFQEAGHYAGFASAHNLFVNEETGFAYVGGASESWLPGGNACQRGLVMLDLSDPVSPTHAGCFNHEGTGRAGTGYVHDVQCVVYRGPDTEHAGREICFGANETALSISDVTDKAAPVALGLGTYPNTGYTHQGWLSEDHRWFFLGDELDELTGGAETTRTLVFDVSDLDDPLPPIEYFSSGTSVDHNMYVTGGRLWQANYTDGVVLLDVRNPEAPRELGRFDTTPGVASSVWNGTWSVYPFFGEDRILASSRDEGLFVLDAGDAVLAATEGAPADLPGAIELLSAFPNPFSASTVVEVRLASAGAARIDLVDVLGRVRSVIHEGPVVVGQTVSLRIEGDGLEAGTYYVRIAGPEGGFRSIPVTRLP